MKADSKFIFDSKTNMTNLDWIAVQALIGMMANSSVEIIQPPQYALEAYKMARAMIAESEKQEKL